MFVVHGPTRIFGKRYPPVPEKLGPDFGDAFKSFAGAWPYARRGAVDSTNYNQTGMVHTIELILGLPPMNQFDLSATPISRAACLESQRW